MTLPIDYSAMLVGVIGCAVYHLLQHCTKSIPTPKKMVEEEQEVTPPDAEPRSDPKKEVTPPDAEPRSDPKKVLHSVLPSVGSVQLAVIVVARAAAKDMEIPTEPQIAFSLLYILYRCVASPKFATVVEDAETSNAAPENNAEKEQKDLATKSTKHSCLKTVQEEQKEAHPPAAEPSSKPQKVLNNVLPSEGSIQLAVILLARAAAKDMGLPTEPVIAFSLLC